ncbi:MAG: type II toxin-antitoxin system RelE/ParE family toxin [Hyphomicrobiales bacterium]|nr:type II toxin-antitoxin system RelE/ParE family toxin [Hyphomicrobiales bacterium]
MPRLIRTARAEEDLSDIWRYIAQDNPAAADRLLDRIDSACARLAENPKLGRVRSDIANGLRYSIVGRYLILYREIREGIEIVRVVHGARHLPDLI